jgi:membrane peptidoglycan carboxypeptidase
MNQILSDDANRTIGFGTRSVLNLSGHVVAAKTGTTSDFKDNLTIGWTPQLVTATWVGNADNHPMRGTTGLTGAAPIWHAFMEQALNGKPDNWPAPPADVEPADYQGHRGFILKGTSIPGTPALQSGAGGGMKRADDGACVPWAHLENALRIAGYRGPFDDGPAMQAAYQRASHTTLSPC